MENENQQLDAGPPATGGEDANTTGSTSAGEASIAGNESQFEGNELADDDFSDETDISGDELDEDDEGLNTVARISGDELSDDDLSAEDQTPSRSTQPAISQASPATDKGVAAKMPDENKVRPSAWIKRSIYLLSTVGLIVVVMVGYQNWHGASFQPEPTENVIQQPVHTTVAPIKLDAFIIPYHQGNFSYISLDVTMDVPAGPIRNEMIAKLGLIRGRIFESLKMYIQKIEDVPSPDNVKAIVSKAVSASLSKGEIGDLYLTRFLVI